MTVQETRKQYQLTQWTQMIKECRSSGQLVSSWCKGQGIRPQTYYYRLRKVREAACQQIPSEPDPETDFISVAFPVYDDSIPAEQTACIRSGNISIALMNNASTELIQNMLKACRYAG